MDTTITDDTPQDQVPDVHDDQDQDDDTEAATDAEDDSDRPAPVLRQVGAVFHGTPAAVSWTITALTGGSAQIIAHAARWVGEELPVRLVPLGIGGGLLYLVPDLRTGPMLWLEITTWCAVAIKLHHGKINKTAGESGEQPTPAAPAQQVADAVLSLWVEYAVAAAELDGRKGIHLDDLTANLHTAGRLLDHDANALRARLLRLGIPVRDQLKISGSNRRGIHSDDLQAALGHMLRLAPPDVPDLTHDRANNPTTTPPECDPNPAPSDPSRNPSPAALADAQ